jgi:hypothetical protein
MEYVDEVVPDTVGVDDPLEQAMEEEPAGQAMEEAPLEQSMEEAPPTEAPLDIPPATPAPRIRKVRVNAPTAAPPPQPPPHVYWPSRLQEHRDAQRAEKNERYSNLRLT